MFKKGFITSNIIAVIAVVAVIAGIAYYNLQPEGEIMVHEGEEMMEEGEKMMEEGEGMMEDGTMMKEDGEKMMMEDDGNMMMEDGNEDTMMKTSYAGKVIAGDTSKLLEFNKADYDSAIASDKLVVLYFYANWCPLCKAEFPKAEAAFDELTTDQVVGFRVHYKDDEITNDMEDLAREFGVSSQHTKVFIKDGGRIMKTPETWDKSRYLEEITNALK